MVTVAELRNRFYDIFAGAAADVTHLYDGWDAEGASAPSCRDVIIAVDRVFVKNSQGYQPLTDEEIETAADLLYTYEINDTQGRLEELAITAILCACLVRSGLML